MRAIVTAVLLVLLSQAATPQSATPSSASPKQFASSDGTLTAIVFPTGKVKGLEEYESRVEIHRKDGTLLCVHDFSSSDGEHGYGVDVAQWTPDLRFFVFRMRSSGGHSPMYAPVVFWSRKANRFYQLNDYTADEVFAVTSPDKVSVNTWPDMKPVTISLHQLGKTEVTTLGPVRDNSD